MGDDCDWIGLGNHDKIPRKTVRLRDRYLTIVSKTRCVYPDGCILEFSAEDIPDQPVDGSFSILDVEFCAGAMDNVFCKKAYYGNKELVAPLSEVTLPFIAKHWEPLLIPPGAVLSMQLVWKPHATTLERGQTNAVVVASFAVRRLREAR